MMRLNRRSVSIDVDSTFIKSRNTIRLFHRGHLLCIRFYDRIEKKLIDSLIVESTIGSRFFDTAS